MKKEILNIICCPKCYKNFELLNAVYRKNEIYSGALVCSRCNTEYLIANGLPIILRDSNKMAKTKKAFGKQWLWWNKGYFEEETIYGKNEQEELEEFRSVLGITKPNNLSGKLILDAGCGSGRLTKNIGKFAKNAIVIGVDISDSAKVAYESCKESSNVHIVQSDISNLPLRPNSCDYIWSEGVIHHTPNSLESFRVLSNKLSKNGTIYIWVYPNYKLRPYEIARKILWKPYIFPPYIRYLFSWLFALPLFFVFKISGKKYKLKSIAFSFFDSFSPEFQHRHSKEEVKGWFVLHKYRDFKILGDLGVVGKK